MTQESCHTRSKSRHALCDMFLDEECFRSSNASGLRSDALEGTQNLASKKVPGVIEPFATGWPRSQRLQSGM